VLHISMLMKFQSYRDVALLNQDGMNKLLTVTNQLIYEKWIKLTDMCRTQVNSCWLFCGFDDRELSVTWASNTIFVHSYCKLVEV